MKKSQIESGRSMVEMLGVLVIIGVLSVGGIAGYKMAMERIVVNQFMERLSLIYNAAQTANSMPGSYMQCCTRDTIKPLGFYYLDCQGEGADWRQEQMAELKALLPAEYCSRIIKNDSGDYVCVLPYRYGTWEVNIEHKDMLIGFSQMDKTIYTPNVCRQIMKNVVSAYGDTLSAIGDNMHTNWTGVSPTDEGIEYVCTHPYEVGYGHGMSFRFNSVKAWEDCVTE